MIGQPRKHFDTITSTNIIAREWALQGAPHGAIVTADEQTAGAGRRGRTWTSVPGKGIYVSIVLRPERITQPQHYTMMVAVAACRALEKLAHVTAQTKWPNDILLQKHKVGGILSESELRQDGSGFVITGLGLNINQTAAELPARALYPASSLYQISGKEYILSDALQKVLSEIENCDIADSWPQIRAEFEERCIFMGDVIGLQAEDKKYFGVAERIDDDGFLWLRTTNGPKRFVSGEIIE